MAKARASDLALAMLAVLLLSVCGGDSSTVSTTPTPAPTPTPTPTPAPTPDEACVPSPSGLVAWWPADGNTSDVVGNRNGTLVGAATFAEGMVDKAFRFPNAGKSAPDFTGTDWVAVPHDSAWNLGSRSFTIEMWVNLANAFSEAPHQQPLVGHTEGPGPTNKWIVWLQNGSLTFHANSPHAPGFNPLGYSWSPALGEWHHVAVTREGSSWTLFVDGQQAAAGTDTRAIPDANADLTLGKAEDTWLEGLLDEVAIYDRALSSAEIGAIFRAGNRGRCKP